MTSRQGIRQLLQSQARRHECPPSRANGAGNPAITPTERCSAYIQLPEDDAHQGGHSSRLSVRYPSITVSRGPTGKYYASILCEDGCEAPPSPPSSRTTGCDKGCPNSPLSRAGKKIANPRHLINASRNLRRKQKAIVSQEPWQPTVVARRQPVRPARTANARADFQHKLSHDGRNQAVIVGGYLVPANSDEKSQTGLRHWRCWLHGFTAEV